MLTGAMGGRSGGGGGANRAQVFNRNVALVTGLITTVSKLGLLAPVVFAKTGGNANLTLNTSTGGVSATVALAQGATQSMTGTISGADGVVIPFTLNCTGQPVVPAAPALTATAGDGQVTLSWTDGSNGGSAITAHKLYRGTVSGSLTLLGTIMTGSPYVDTGLTNDQAYFYKLSAVNAIGEGALSTERSATPAVPTGPRVALVVVHTDSRGRGIFTADRPGVDDWPSWLTQYVSDFDAPGTADHGYPLTPGFTADVPLQGAATYESVDYLSPMEYAARRIYDEGAYDHVVLIGSHWGGLRLVDSLTFHLSYTVDKMEAALVDAATEFPGAVFDKIISIQFGANDLAGAESAADVRSAMETTIPALLGATGWSDAKIMGISCLPEILSSYDARVDTACRIPFLGGVGYWQQLPSGLGTLHEGETFTIAEVREAGYDHMGRTASVALDLIAPASPNFTLTDNFEVTEGSDTDISVACDQPFYLTGMSAGGALATFSPDLELVNQVIRPVGGAWPAFDAGTPANNTRAYTPAYITGDRVTGTLPRHVVIAEDVAVTYLAYDNFNRADTTPSPTGLGATSGDGSTGGGLTWVVKDSQGDDGLAGIDTNKARVQWGGGDNGIYNRCGVDVGAADVKVRCTITASGSGWKPGIFAAGDIAAGYGVFMRADGTAYLRGVFGDHSFGNFTAPSGTYELGIDINTTTKEATFYVDGAVVLGPVQTAYGDAIPTTQHHAGFDTFYIADDHRWDNFSVVARV